jgi:hypothetical protein
MAASPNKALLTVARQALALLDPDWQRDAGRFGPTKSKSNQEEGL